MRLAVTLAGGVSASMAKLPMEFIELYELWQTKDPLKKPRRLTSGVFSVF